MKIKIIQCSVVLVGLFSLSSAMATSARVFVAGGLSSVDTMPTDLSLAGSRRINSLSEELGIGIVFNERLSFNVSRGYYDVLYRLGGYDIFGNGFDATDLEKNIDSTNFKLQFVPFGNTSSRLQPYVQLGYSRWTSLVTLTSGTSATSVSDSGTGINYGAGIKTNDSSAINLYLEINEYQLSKAKLRNAFLGAAVTFF